MWERKENSTLHIRDSKCTEWWEKVLLDSDVVLKTSTTNSTSRQMQKKIELDWHIQVIKTVGRKAGTRAIGKKCGV